MAEEGERRVCGKSSGDEIGKVDRLKNLPDELLYKILLNLPTKDVVKCSVLSKRLGDLWPLVLGLDLDCGDFPNCDAFVTFVDRFLGFSKSSLHNFKLKSSLLLGLNYQWGWNEAAFAHVTWLINNVLKRKVQHIHVLNVTSWLEFVVEIRMLPSIYTSESLVSLKLNDVTLLNPKSFSLPCVKVIRLDSVKFANDWVFEVSGCPVLESLTVKRCPYDNIQAFRVCSQSLLSFTLFGHKYNDVEESHEVAIDAPRLEYLNLFKDKTDRFIINNLGSLVRVFTDTTFSLSFENKFDLNNLPKRNMIRSFLLGISSVKDMLITLDTLKVIYDYSRCERVPLLPKVSFLYVFFVDYRWEMLPILLESCPNLKSLVMGFNETHGEEEGDSILSGPRRFLTSLEYVKIVMPMVEEASEMKLVSYFLENSTILKEFNLCLGDFRKKEESVILRKLLAIPRLSSSCQVFVQI